MDSSLRYMASKVDPHESGIVYIQCNPTLSTGFVGYHSSWKWEWGIPKFKYLT